MGQAKSRGTREERVKAAQDAKVELALLAQVRAKERLRLQKAREAADEAESQAAFRTAAACSSLTGRKISTSASQNPRRLSSYYKSAALMAAMAGALLAASSTPARRRELTERPKPGDLEDF